MKFSHLFFNIPKGRDEWVIELCTRGLVLEPGNVKMLYRRGAAFVSMQDFTRATADLLKVLELDRGNTAAAEKLAQIRAQIRVDDAKMGKALRTMFSSTSKEEGETD